MNTRKYFLLLRIICFEGIYEMTGRAFKLHIHYWTLSIYIYKLVFYFVLYYVSAPDWICLPSYFITCLLALYVNVYRHLIESVCQFVSCLLVLIILYAFILIILPVCFCVWYCFSEFFPTLFKVIEEYS